MWVLLIHTYEMMFPDLENRQYQRNKSSEVTPLRQRFEVGGPRTGVSGDVKAFDPSDCHCLIDDVDATLRLVVVS